MLNLMQIKSFKNEYTSALLYIEHKIQWTEILHCLLHKFVNYLKNEKWAGNTSY